MNSSKILEDSIFQIGRVVSVEGRTIKVKVDKTKNSSHLLYKGDLLKNISVGGYIKIIKGFTVIIGKVEGEFITEDRFFEKKYYGSEREKINRVLNVSLLGFFTGKKFERGIKELPLIDNECFLVHRREFEIIHDFVKKDDVPIKIGNLALEKGQAINVGINSLFASHIGIFGNTGSGKSYTLAKIYRELFERFKSAERFVENAKFFFIDFNGEYVNSNPACDHVIVNKDFKNIYRLSTRDNSGDKYPISHEAINDPEFWIVFLEATEKTQTPFLRRAVDNPFLASRVTDQAALHDILKRMILAATTDSSRIPDKMVVINLLIELSACLGRQNTLSNLIDEYKRNLQFDSRQNKYYYDLGQEKVYSEKAKFKQNIIDSKVDATQLDLGGISLIDQVRIRIVIQYYDEIIKGFSNREHLGPLIKRMDSRINDLNKVISVESNTRSEKNITIVSLKDVNVHMRKILPLLLCKKLYLDKKSEKDESKYLNLIIDEAHNILSESSERESEQWKDYRLETFEEIIKEGRKFGVFLTIASQRPSDISPTIISQLHNYFLHRLINNEDIRAVEKTISYLDKVSFEYLPILPTGTCIMAGLLANVPVVVDIDKIEPPIHEPINKTITLVDKWN